jgi:hypothetical protein
MEIGSGEFMRAMRCIVWLPWRTVLYLALLRFDLLALLYLLCSAGIAWLCFACFTLLRVALQVKLRWHSNCIALLCFVIGESWTVMVNFG